MTTNAPPQWEPGRLLQTARETKGLSMRQAATKAGISHGHYRWIENGTRLTNGEHQQANPSPEALHNAAVAVGADPDRVLTAAGLDPNAPIKADLHRAVDELPANMMKPALHMLRGLADQAGD